MSQSVDRIYSSCSGLSLWQCPNVNREAALSWHIFAIDMQRWRWSFGIFWNVNLSHCCHNIYLLNENQWKCQCQCWKFARVEIWIWIPTIWLWHCTVGNWAMTKKVPGKNAEKSDTPAILYYFSSDLLNSNVSSSWMLYQFDHLSVDSEVEKGTIWQS